jgi:hypothetical protein
MRKLENNLITVILMTSLFLSLGIAQDYQKVGQTSFKFLNVVSDARAVAMGNAMTSLQISSSALFFNPAGMSGMENTFDITASTNQWIADIRHYTFSAAVSLKKGDWGVVGFSLQYVDYGNFIGTRVSTDPGNLKGYDDIGIFKLYALAAGVGYAKKLTERFSIGGQIRWARQDLGQTMVPNPYKHIPIYAPTDTAHTTILGYEDSSMTATNKLTPLVFDFGTQFKTGIKSLVFGMSVRNFSQEIQYVYEQFQLPLIFTIGISMNLMDLFEKVPGNQVLYVAIDASHYRDHAEQLKMGVEYQVMKILSMRCGYVTNSDEKGFSYGLGVSKFGFAFDYSYTPFGVFNKVQRMTARFSF